MQIKPKKSLGQNFLTDKNIQNKIIDSCQLTPQDTVLEIGSGRGELTCLIADKVEKLFSVEIDKSLYDGLKLRTKEFKNFKLINKDILKFSLRGYFRGLEKKLKVVGNVPYYISTPIIEHLLKYKDKIDKVFITVQKEFARRITASPGSKEYGSLSCFVQYYTEPKIIFYIKRNSFYPAPKVDSALLRLEIRRLPSVKPDNEKLFFKIIRAAFNKRRKTLRNSLEGVLPLKKIEAFFKKYGINKDIRPEDLSLADFANLANA